MTLGFWSERRFPTRDVLPYIVAPCLGAIAASALLGWLLGPVGNFGATVLSVTLARAFVIELGYTGLLGFVIMAVATDERTPTVIAPFVLVRATRCGLASRALCGERVTMRRWWRARCRGRLHNCADTPTPSG